MISIAWVVLSDSHEVLDTYSDEERRLDEARMMVETMYAMRK